MDLVRQVRKETLTEKSKELEQQKLARSWCIFVASYNLVYKRIFQNGRAYIAKRQLLMISRIIQMLVRAHWFARANRFGETLTIRLKNQTRSALSMLGTAENDSALLRAKDIFTSFAAKCGQCMSFRERTYDSLSKFNLINGQM